MNLRDLEATRFAVQAELDELLEQTDGEVTPEIDAIAERLLGIEMATADKLDRYAYVIKSLESDRDRITERAMVLSQRARSLDKSVERLKELAREYIERNVPERKVVGELHTIWVQANGGVLSLDIEEFCDPHDFSGFYLTKYEWDKEEIRRALEAGMELKFAKLGERGTHLRIK